MHSTAGCSFSYKNTFLKNIDMRKGLFQRSNCEFYFPTAFHIFKFQCSFPMPSIFFLYSIPDICITCTLMNNRYSYIDITKLAPSPFSCTCPSAPLQNTAGYGFSLTPYVGVCLQIHLPAWPCPQ